MMSKILSISAVLILGLALAGCPSSSEEKSSNDNVNSSSVSHINNGWKLVENSLTEQYYEYGPSLVDFNSKIYRAKRAFARGGKPGIFVDVFNSDLNNPEWVSLNTNSISDDSNLQLIDPKLIVFDSKLYLVWTEIRENCNCYWQAQIMVYNGDDSNPLWSSVNGNILSLVPTASHQSSVSPFVFANKLYLTFRHGHTIRVAVYNSMDDSASWSLVDQGGINFGLNNFTGNNSPRLMSSNGKLYAVWGESSGNCCYDRIRVKQYNGNDSSPTWTFIDGGGLNRAAHSRAISVQTISHEDSLYVFWSESEDYPEVYRMHISKYDELTNSWISLDPTDSDGFTYGLSTFAEIPLAAITINGSLYITWLQSSLAFRNTVRIAKLGGSNISPQWLAQDGGSTSIGLITDENHSVSDLAIIPIANKIMMVWSEEDPPNWSSGLVTVIK